MVLEKTLYIYLCTMHSATEEPRYVVYDWKLSIDGDYTLLGEQHVTVPIPAHDNPLELSIAALTGQTQTIMDKARLEKAHVEQRINELLALPAPQ